MTYISTPPRHYGGAKPDDFDWEEFTHDRLTWLYGAERANAIREGRDPKTIADQAAWRGLGKRDAA